MRRHFLFSLRTCERGKTVCGRLGRQTFARTKTSARLKITFVDMTYPGQRPEPPSLSPHFSLKLLISSSVTSTKRLAAILKKKTVDYCVIITSSATNQRREFSIITNIIILILQNFVRSAYCWCTAGTNTELHLFTGLQIHHDLL